MQKAGISPSLSRLGHDGPRQSSGEKGAVAVAALVLPAGDWQKMGALQVGKMLLPVCWKPEHLLGYS